MAGMCICSEQWRQAHTPEAVSTLSALLQAADYGLRFSSIAPDFILNNAGLSIAFVVIMDVRKELTSTISERILKMKANFQNSYVVVTLATEADYSLFADFYFSLSSEIDKPAFLPVLSNHMGFEKMIRMAHVHAECKRQGIVGMVDLERKQFVQSADAMVACISSIPGLEPHDAHSLLQRIGSIEAISRASRQTIMTKTDVSVENADAIVQLFNDNNYDVVLGPTDPSFYKKENKKLSHGFVETRL